MTDKREKPVCPKCGSDDVSFDATAHWDAERQTFTCDPCDEAWCNACTWPDSFQPKWIEIESTESES